MMRGTSAERVISNPWSPIVHTMSCSPSAVSAVANRSISSVGPTARVGSALTTAAAAPSANTDAATICCGSSDTRRWIEQSSTQTTRTTASGSAAQIWVASRSAGSAAAQPMKPRWYRCTVVGRPRSRTSR